MNQFTWQSAGSKIHFDFDGIWRTAHGPRWNDAEWTDILDGANASMRARFSTGEIGFYDWPVTMPASLLADVRRCADELRARFEGLVVLGIGGSYLGPYALVEALRDPRDAETFPIHWVSNIDPQSVERASEFVKKHRCACLVISKSGGTVETMSALFHLAPYLPKDGIVAITDPKKGELRRIATENKWPTFEVPPSIGGRFSVLTAVGLLTTACAGIDAAELIHGARGMRKWLDAAEPEQSPAARFALAQWLWDTQHGAKIQYLMPYWACLRSLADWNVQLWGESLGKCIKNDPSIAVGPTPVSALGSSDQHSLLQLFQEGPKDKVIGFVDTHVSALEQKIGTPPFDPGSLSYLTRHTFTTLSKEASLATQRSLSESGVATYRIDLGELGPATLGAWMFFMQAACAYAAELYHVDAYDQPGVEGTKILWKQALE